MGLLFGDHMENWTKHIDAEGDVNEETEVHQLSLELLILEVSKQTGHKLWTGSIMHKDSCDIVGKQHFDHDPEHCKVMLMVRGMELLEADAKKLAETMMAMGHKPTDS